jgi:hypothetical protein
MALKEHEYLRRTLERQEEREASRGDRDPGDRERKKDPIPRDNADYFMISFVSSGHGHETSQEA